MYTVQISIMRDLIYGAVSHGASLHGLCEKMGITPQFLNDAENHMNWEVASEFWNQAVAMTGDEQLGLHLGQELSHSAFGMLGYLAQSCRTLEESCVTIVKYNNTVSSIFKYSLDLSDKFAHVCFEPMPLYLSKYPESARQAVDTSASSFARSFRTLTGKKIYPVEVEMSFPKRNAAEYEKILGAPVRFGAARSCLTLTREDLQTPIISYDKSLFSLFSTILTNKQKSFYERKTWVEKIKSLVLIDFKGQAPPVEIVASKLSMTIRTLQRKLAEEGTSYRDICTGLQKELSREMLSSNLKKEEVAALLGYSDASTLRRKYKSWSKTSEIETT